MAKKIKKIVKRKPTKRSVIKKSTPIKRSNNSIEDELREFVKKNKSCIITAGALLVMGIGKENISENEIVINDKLKLHKQNNETYFIHY